MVRIQPWSWLPSFTAKWTGSPLLPNLPARGVDVCVCGRLYHFSHASNNSILSPNLQSSQILLPEQGLVLNGKTFTYTHTLSGQVSSRICILSRGICWCTSICSTALDCARCEWRCSLLDDADGMQQSRSLQSLSPLAQLASLSLLISSPPLSHQLIQPNTIFSLPHQPLLDLCDHGANLCLHQRVTFHSLFSFASDTHVRGDRNFLSCQCVFAPFFLFFLFHRLSDDQTDF